METEIPMQTSQKQISTSTAANKVTASALCLAWSLQWIQFNHHLCFPESSELN